MFDSGQGGVGAGNRQLGVGIAARLDEGDAQAARLHQTMKGLCGGGGAIVSGAQDQRLQACLPRIEA